ncbi:MAG: gamma-glutamyltransferase [Glaciecola sp.]
MTMTQYTVSIVSFLLLLSASLAPQAATHANNNVALVTTKQAPIIPKAMAVAAPDSYSSDVAMDILQRGGNAIDAAVAAQFVLAVTLPEAGNIGGGGFMLIHTPTSNDFIDYRETAPLSASRDMYLDAQGNAITRKSLYGVLASGTPGTVAGMVKAHALYGSLPWKDLVQPAVDLAQNGFIVHPKLGRSINEYIEMLATQKINVNFAQYFSAAKTGERFVQPELAQTLIRIRDKGMAGFYAGKTADIIHDFMASNNGLITKQDLAQYRAKQRQPIATQWREFELLSAPPPSSGGIAITQWLAMFERLNPRIINADGTTSPRLPHNSPEYVHLLAEIGKRVFADRAEYLGDPDYVTIPQHALTNAEYITERASGVKRSGISITKNIKPGLPESEQTTHFSILDKYGNAVSNTTTINLGFGNGVVVEGAGFLLNNEMDDFSVKAGVPNFFGAVGGTANEIQPNKRMLSSMSPTIVLQDNKVKVITGSPGGTTIISSVYQSILHILEFGMRAQEAVDTPRFHHQLLPVNQIRHHVGLPDKTTNALTEMGYTLKESRYGDLHLISVNGDRVEAASESHGRGKAQVFMTR